MNVLQRRKHEFHSIIALHCMQSYLSFLLYLHSIFPLFLFLWFCSFFTVFSGVWKGVGKNETLNWNSTACGMIWLQLESLNFHIMCSFFFAAIKRVESHLVAVFLHIKMNYLKPFFVYFVCVCMCVSVCD